MCAIIKYVTSTITCISTNNREPYLSSLAIAIAISKTVKDRETVKWRKVAHYQGLVRSVSRKEILATVSEIL